jgi:hypothetical protein
MAGTSSCGEPVNTSDATVVISKKYTHAQYASSATHVEDNLVLENVLVLIDGVSV